MNALYSSIFLLNSFIIYFTSINTLHKKFDRESGIIYYTIKNSLISTEDTIVRSFTNYGEKEKLTTVSAAGNIKMNLLQVGEYQYLWVDSIQCVKTKRQLDFSFQNLDLNQLRRNPDSSYAIIKKPITSLNGLKCSQYNIKNQKGEEVELWQWMNIPIKIVFTSNGNTQVTEAFNVDTLSISNSAVFEIPEGIQVVEVADK